MGRAFDCLASSTYSDAPVSFVLAAWHPSLSSRVSQHWRTSVSFVDLSGSTIAPDVFLYFSFFLFTSWNTCRVTGCSSLRGTVPHFQDFERPTYWDPNERLVTRNVCCLPLRHKCAQEAAVGFDLQATSHLCCYLLIACKSVLFSHATTTTTTTTTKVNK